jgi:uncharacterized membrane protein YhaH (DUF805 family)
MKNLKSYLSFLGNASKKEYWSIVAISILGVFAFDYFFSAISRIVFNSSPVLSIYYSPSVDIFLWDLSRLFKSLIGSSPFYYKIYGFLHLIYPIFFCWLFLAVTSRRLADVGWSRWLCIVTLIPLVGNIFSVILGLLDSAKNENGSFLMILHNLGKRHSRLAGIFLKYFTFEGRASRQEYWVTFAVSCVFFIVGWSAYYATALSDCEIQFVAFVGDAVKCSGRWIYGYDSFNIVLGVVEGRPSVLWLFFFPLGLFSALLYLSVATRRIRDLGLNPWIVVTTLIPYLGVIPAIAIGALPSEPE